MKICILSGSPHKHGNTMQLVERYTAGAKTSGHEVTFFDTVRMDIPPCMGCMACKKKSDGCIQHDDMEEIYPAVRDADVLVFATPMYWWNVSGPLKTAIDRLFALPFNIRRGGFALKGKRLRMLLTSGGPPRRNCNPNWRTWAARCVTSPAWSGSASSRGGNTGDQPVADDAALLEKAFHAGAALN
ncbi:MAG: flavodoxin family protein [Desulfovibrio sp.]|nr:flavodoxin family protein [Desulfovibrio sp.]